MNQNRKPVQVQSRNMSKFEIKLLILKRKLKKEFKYQGMMLAAYLFLLIPGGKVVLLVDKMFKETSFHLPMVLIYLYNYVWLIGTLIYLNAKDAGVMPKFAPFPFRVREFYNVRYKNQLLPRNTCLTCGLVRPLRTSHCRLCNRCINEFDHHCGWTGNCVGRRNKGRFILFVINVFLNSLFAFVVSLAYLLYFPTSSVSDTIFITIITFAFALTTIALGSLFVQHIFLAFIGKTTYEQIKSNNKRKEALKKYLKMNGVKKECNCQYCRQKKMMKEQEKMMRKQRGEEVDEESSETTSSSSDDSEDNTNNTNQNNNMNERNESNSERMKRLRKEFEEMDDIEKKKRVKQLKNEFYKHYKMNSPYLTGFKNFFELLFRSSPPQF